MGMLPAFWGLSRLGLMGNEIHEHEGQWRAIALRDGGG